MRVLWAVLMLGAFTQAHAQAGIHPAPGSKTASPRAADTPTPVREPATSGSSNSKPKVAPRSAPASKRTRAAPARAGRSARRRSSADTVNLGTTSITGNQELPKVLYIVPWKQSNLGDVVGRPANTLLDEVLAPLDPAVFERRLKYYETLNGSKEKE